MIYNPKNPRYMVFIQCFETPEECLGDFYVDYVNDCFFDIKDAFSAMLKYINEDVVERNNCSEITYHAENNKVVDEYGNIVSVYAVQEIDFDFMPVNEILKSLFGDSFDVNIISFVDEDDKVKYLWCSNATNLDETPYESCVDAMYAAIRYLGGIS